ncbi:hypothetical protein ACXJJ3_42100 (plasmid) [Kribbella sp. WER1]
MNIAAADVGVIRAKFAHDWRYGVTTYEVEASRVAGVFVLGVEPLVGERDGVIDQDSDRLRVEFGRRAGGDPYYSEWKPRDDLPCVNGVQLIGTVGVSLAQLRRERLTGRRMYVRRINPRGTAPDATAERTALVVDALAYHWLSCPENYELRLTAAQAAIKAVTSSRAATIRAARKDISRAQGQIATARAEIRAARVFAAIDPRQEGAA